MVMKNCKNISKAANNLLITYPAIIKLPSPRIINNVSEIMQNTRDAK